MGVVVRKSLPEVVKPPEVAATSTDHISLSPFDKIVLSRPVTMLLVFDGSIHEPTETIKRALSKALMHYLPIAGRFDDELRITLTGDGVPFVAAATSCALKDIDDLSEQDEQQLAIYYPAGLDDPLLMMQVTEFSCGGFVVGVTWNHAIADAAGMGQFLQAVGELARGLSTPLVVPVRSWDDDLVRGWVTGGFLNLMKSLPQMDMAILHITITSRVISGIREEYRRVHSNPCTTFEAITALLWQCRTRAIGLSNPDDPVAIYFVANVRKYVRAREGYYGNCVTGQFVMATRDAVANGHLVEVVEMIRRAKSQVADQFHSNQGGAKVQHARNQLVGYNLFVVTSWRNLGLEEVDFGGGRPVRVARCSGKRVAVPACFACQGCDGSNLVRCVFVTEEHAGAFLGEVSSRFK